MPHPFDELLQAKHAFPNREEVINEVVFRSPGPLGSYVSATHIPLVDEGIEDFFFKFVSSGLKIDLRKTEYRVNIYDIEKVQSNTVIFPNKSTITSTVLYNFTRKGTGLLSIEDRWEQLGLGILWDDDDTYKKITQAARRIDRIFIYVLENNPEYFIFGRFTQLGRIVYNALLNKHPASWQISGECQRLIAGLEKLLRLFSYTIRDFIQQRIINAANNLGSHLPNVGGIVANFKLESEKTHPHRKVETFEEDFLDLDLSDKDISDDHNVFLLRWRRANQYWSYTFFESAKYVPFEPDKPPTEEEMSNLPLAQQSKKVKEDYRKSTERFISLCATFGRAPSVLESPRLRELIPEDSARFPGKLLAGAHYLFVPFGLLLFILYLPDAAAMTARFYLDKLRRLGLEQGRPVAADDVLRRFLENVAFAHRAPEYRLFLGIIREIYVDVRRVDPGFEGKLADILENGLNPLENGLNPPTVPPEGYQQDTEKSARPPTGLSEIFSNNHEEIFDIGWRLWLWMEKHDDRVSDVGRIITRFCTDFWSACGLNLEARGKNALDFISCFVVDRKAIYFTNFQPMGNDRFTRTLFVDFALTGYQRGRLAQRLCDIATQRSIHIRDVNRVRSMLGGMEEITREINTLQERPIALFDVDGNPDDAAMKDQIRDSERMRQKLDEYQQQMDRLNLFAVYGIQGRWASGNDALTEIQKLTTDIRESRIGGFATLGDFLQRRVAEVMRDIKRMSDRHEYLGSRIRDFYDRIRTRLNSVQTADISKFTGAAATTLNALGNTAAETRALTITLNRRIQQQQGILEKMQEIEGRLSETAERQERLGILLDVFAVIAGTYYVYAFLYTLEPFHSLAWSYRTAWTTLVMFCLVAVVATTRWRLNKEKSAREARAKEARAKITQSSGAVALSTQIIDHSVAQGTDTYTC